MVQLSSFAFTLPKKIAFKNEWHAYPKQREDPPTDEVIMLGGPRPNCRCWEVVRVYILINV